MRLCGKEHIGSTSTCCSSLDKKIYLTLKWCYALCSRCSAVCLPRDPGAGLRPKGQPVYSYEVHLCFSFDFQELSNEHSSQITVREPEETLEHLDFIVCPETSCSSVDGSSQGNNDGEVKCAKTQVNITC